MKARTDRVSLGQVPPERAELTKICIPPWHRGIRKHRALALILNAELVPTLPGGLRRDPERIWMGWGNKPSGRGAERVAAWRGERSWRVEDGFLRSYGAGPQSTALSTVIDDTGIYYDATRPSALERMLQSEANPAAGLEETAASAVNLIREHRLSKYNAAPEVSPELFQPLRPRRVLVVDQTYGDQSVRLGGATPDTFTAMLAAAKAENPDATILVKTHPEVSSGAKQGYLTSVVPDERVVVIRDAVNPASLIEQVDRVYVVTSHLGFEALLNDRPVSCFGVPWYSGWGLTDDRQRCSRRTRTRTLAELFAVAYLRYSRYLDPVRHVPGTIFDVIEYLRLQKAQATWIQELAPGRFIGIGFSQRKRRNVGPLLETRPGQVLFDRTADQAAARAPGPADTLVCWGRRAPQPVRDLAAATGAKLLNMEDGFIRSVGLGSNFVPPMSIVVDRRGMYFDASQESDLEHLLNQHLFDDADLARAARVRETICAQGITKYNVERRITPSWADNQRRIVLVPGQVEDDASIRFGCEDIARNDDLLKAARTAEPDALIVYKPHPDVVSKNRSGVLLDADARRFADIVETRSSVISCIDACDAVHTMTSLTGFDALLRGRDVVVYGRPFYAGWGLTHDRLSFQRRHRELSLDMLVAGALLHYPLYWDWLLRGYTTCEAVIERIVEERDSRQADHSLDRWRRGRLRQRWANRLKRLRA